MQLRDRCSAVPIDWKRLRKELRPFLESKDAPPTREIYKKTGVAPSTLTRWSDDSNDPIDVDKLALVLDVIGGITISELFTRIQVLPNSDGSRKNIGPVIPSSKGPNESDSVSSDGGGVSLADLQLGAMRALGLQLTESFEHAVDRAADRIIAALEQTPRARSKKTGGG